MKYGKTTLVCKKGFYIDSSLLRPIGIFEESNCWGVFAKHDKNYVDKRSNDLIIAPFPYRSWACIVKLQIRVKDNSKTVKNILSILDIIDKNKLNILSLQIIFSGYSHYILDMTVELSDVRNHIEEYKKNNTPTKKCLSKIFIEIFSIMRIVIESIESTNKNKNFLYVNSRKKEHFDYNDLATEVDKKDKKDKKSIKRYAKKYILSSVEWRWLSSLALHAFQNKEQRLRFKYEHKKTNGLLTFDLDNSDYSDISHVFSALNKDYQRGLPFLAMTSFNLEHQHLRIRAVSVDKDNSLININTKYDTKINANLEKGKIKISKYGSRGLTHAILSKVINEDENFKLNEISVEGLQRENQKNEKGMVLISGISSETLDARSLKKNVTEFFSKKIRKEIRNGNHEIGNEQKTQTTKINIDIHKEQPFKVFLSFRQDLTKDTKNLDTIKSLLIGHGFNVIVSQTKITGITSNVMKDMEECNACLQIYTLSDKEKKTITHQLTNDFVPDHAWLLFEYGLAMQKNIPIGRMIDTTHLPKEQWEKHLRIGKDTFLTEFSGDVCSESEIENSFIKQFDKLAQDLLMEINKEK